ncbi:hypothetical protein CLV49_1966 [Labedella gwakjiensis]|uniref:Uncharacterized protein n=1 Tax=Labedella gwakjiensis TaxID=390269 RepID=A0A2P8GWL2_9MICO|nr:hypothetical protein [Labedella gwakjiensis]PSL38345.1 hypothetical protein CLV49_1966 [Labedella gwakjiensis]RUQ87122.1 hypothetical protein ELQ93_09385 [Labedella gwakjiensis]
MALWRSLSATALLLTAMAVGLGGGFLSPARFDTNVILWPAIFAQTVIAVGGLRPDWLTDSSKRSDAVRLLLVHHTAATAPFLAAWFLLPVDARASPLWVGLVWLAIVPTAAGLPAYASAARTAPSTMAAFALLAYVCGLVVTPLLSLVIFGGGTDIGRLLVAMFAGLIVPASLGILLGRWVRRIPPRVRTGVVAVCMTLTTYVFASAMSDSLAGDEATGTFVAVALLAGAARIPVSIGIGLLVSARWTGLRAPSVLAAGYKNDALAASSALQVAGPLAVIPALGSLLCESLMLLIASFANHRRTHRPMPPDTPRP